MRINILLPLPPSWNPTPDGPATIDVAPLPVQFDVATVERILSILFSTPSPDVHQSARGTSPAESPRVILEIGVINVDAPSVSYVEQRLAPLAIAGIAYEPSRPRHVLQVDADRRAITVARAHASDPSEGEVLPWGLKRVGASRAWRMGYTGVRRSASGDEPIRIAVVDTGVGPNCDLPRPIAARSFVPGVGAALDDFGHGTGVASICLANGGGSGVVGVAPEADLIVAKVVDSCGRAESDWMAAGVVWSATRRAHVINMSFGDDFTLVMQRAVEYAFMSGCTLCAAAGNNDGTTCAPVMFPASSPLCIAVAGLDQDNRHIPSSNCGPELTVAAPGVDIQCAGPNDKSINDGRGTSVASPHAAGVAALLLSAKDMSPSAVKHCLQVSARPIKPKTKFGFGLVRADRAIACALAGKC